MTKTKSCWLSTLLCLTWSMAACKDDTSIGTNECIGARTDCRIPARTDLTLKAIEVSTQGVPTLDATWTKNLEDPGLWPMLLTPGATGSLWLFKNRGTHLEVSELDDTGQKVGRSVKVEPPVPDAELQYYDLVSSEAPGPVLDLSYRLPCSEAPDFASDDIDCLPGEVMAFDKNIHDPPWRYDLLHFSYDTVRRAKDGHLWRVVEDSVQKIDHTGELLIRQDAAPLEGAVAAKSSATVLPSGDLALAQYVADNYSSLIFRRLDADGNIEHYSSLLGVDLGQESLHSLHDSQGRWVVLATASNGDLLMTRVDEKSAALTGFRVLREDYTDLSVNATAVDAGGNVYAAVAVGGRDLRQQTHVLCRLPEHDRAQCFLVPELFFGRPLEVRSQGIVGGAANVVYAFSTQGEFARYDLPE